MPKSRLKIEGLQLSDIESLQATRTRVSVGIINGVKAPRFIQEVVRPSIRPVSSLQTDEVEYDTYVQWAISQVPPIAFTGIIPSGTGHSVDENGNVSSIFGCGLENVLSDMNGWEEEEISYGIIYYNYYFPTKTGNGAQLIPGFDINSAFNLSADFAITAQDVFRSGYTTEPDNPWWYFGVGDVTGDFIGMKMVLDIDPSNDIYLDILVVLVNSGSELGFTVNSIYINPLIQPDGSVGPISGSIQVVHDGTFGYTVTVTVGSYSISKSKTFSAAQNFILKAMSNGTNTFPCWVNLTNITL